MVWYVSMRTYIWYYNTWYFCIHEHIHTSLRRKKHIHSINHLHIINTFDAIFQASITCHAFKLSMSNRRGPWCTCQRSSRRPQLVSRSKLTNTCKILLGGVYISLLEHLRLKNCLVISSLSFGMIDDPRLHSICLVVWNGCLLFSTSWSLSKCCRKQFP